MTQILPSSIDGFAMTVFQCGAGSIPRLGVICGLVLFSAPRGFSPRTPVFPSPQKPTFDLICIDLISFDFICARPHKLFSFKGARSRNFRQFQHGSNGHRINWNIKITVQNYRRTLTKHREAKKGHGWTKMERIEMDWIWVNLKNVSPPFFKFISVYIKMSFTQLEHSQLLCGRDFANERLLLCQFDV